MTEFHSLANAKFFLAKRIQCKGLIPRQRNALREAVYAKYGWLHMNNSIEFSLREKKIRFDSEKSVLLTAKAKRAREFNKA